jgi:hypothetical protein
MSDLARSDPTWYAYEKKNGSDRYRQFNCGLKIESKALAVSDGLEIVHSWLLHCQVAKALNWGHVN